MRPGDKLGPYEIVSRLGEGGMGEVYRASDPRLGREIAIKTSRSRFNERFTVEARAIAALNHPNICTLHDIGPDYLVMELVEGTTPEGPMPVDAALNLARQIAEALDAAHQKGIVHRDLKPANVKVTPSGLVKVLDFGLARINSGDTLDPGDMPTGIASPTIAGTILGTAAYMAPEQARGKAVDKRADIWAFGVTLYEMVTGERLFKGDNIQDILAGVLREEPDLSKLPANVRRLVAKCLQKDPAKRLRDIADWDQLLVESHAVLSADAVQRAPVRPTLWMAAFAAATLVAAGLSAVHFLEKPPSVPVIDAAIAPPPDAAFEQTSPAFSPDGRQLVFSATSGGRTQLWLRSLDSPSAHPIAGTDDASDPFWSPDGKAIGFAGLSKLRRVDLASGSVRDICDAVNVRGATWGAENVILFGKQAVSLLRVPASGGTPSPASRPAGGDSFGHAWPVFLPDGKHFVYAARELGRSAVEIRAGTVGSFDSTRLFQADSPAAFASGNLLFLRGRTLMAQPFDTRRMAVSGEAAAVAENVGSAFSASPGGDLAFLPFTRPESQLTWFDRSGKRSGIAGQPGIFEGPLSLSPDGRSLASSVTDVADGSSDIWIYDFARNVRNRLTFDRSSDDFPVWSPDGKTVAFSFNRTGELELFRKPADGSRPQEQVTNKKGFAKFATSWSPDGRSLLYFTIDKTAASGGTLQDIWSASDPEGRPVEGTAVIQTKSNETDPRISPDGHWLAYVSDESGRYEVYTAPFPVTGAKRQISPAGGTRPRWRRDGRELFYVEGVRLMAVETAIRNGVLEAGAPHPLFAPVAGHYDVSADGQRIILAAPMEGSAATPLTLVHNWLARIKK